jgi:hypothetical protein
MSSSVTALSAAASAVFNSFGVRGWRPRTKVLTFHQQFSIGEKSGEYAGNHKTSALTEVTASST